MTELYQHRTKESMLMMVMVWLVDTHSHLCVYYTEFSGHTHKIQQQQKKQNRICDHPKTLYSIMGEMLCAGFVGNKRHAKRVTKSYRYSIWPQLLFLFFSVCSLCEQCAHSWCGLSAVYRWFGRTLVNAMVESHHLKYIRIKNSLFRDSQNYYAANTQL